MSSSTANTALPLPPPKYDLPYMSRLVRQINLAFNKFTSVGPIICGSDLTSQGGKPISGLSIINVPTSPNGLATGSVWSDGGILKIVS